jgi:hypothetical protein
MRSFYGPRVLIAPFGAIIVGVFDALIAVARHAEYLGEPVYTVRWFCIGMIYILPLTAGLSAIDAARLSAGGVIINQHIAPDLRWRWLWAAGPIAATHTFVILAALVAGQERTARGGWLSIGLAIILQAFAIAWFAAFGSQIGRYFKPAIAGLITVVIGLVLYNWAQGLSSNQASFQLFGDSGASISQIGVVINVQNILLALAFLSITTALFMLTTSRIENTRLTPNAITIVALLSVAGLGIVTTFIPVGPFVLTDGSKPFPDKCVNGAARYCYFHEHERWASKVIAELDPLLASAEQAGYGDVIPQMLVESSRRPENYDLAFTNSLMPVLDYDATQYGNSFVLMWLYNADYCAARHGDPGPPERFWKDQHDLVATIAAVGGFRDPENLPSEEDFTPLSPAAATAIIERWKKCQL